MHLRTWPNDIWDSSRRRLREILESRFVFASRLRDSHRISDCRAAVVGTLDWPSIGPTGDFSLFCFEMGRDLLGWRGAG